MHRNSASLLTAFAAVICACSESDATRAPGVMSQGGVDTAGAAGGLAVMSNSGSPGVSGAPIGGTGGKGTALPTGGSPPSGGASPSGGAPTIAGGSGGTATVDAGGLGPAAGAGGSSAEPPLPCGTGTFDAEVKLDGADWTASRAGSVVYTGPSMRDAMQAAVDSLTPGRVTPESVVVRDSGPMDAGSSVDLASHTLFESCGTIDVSGPPGGNQAVVRGRGVTDVSVTHLSVTGSPYFGVFFRESHDVHLGRIELHLSGGLGVRIDNDPQDNGWGSINRSTNITIDHVIVEGTNNHGVETYGVDGLTIGTVVARDTENSGLLLNATINAEVGLVDAIGAARGPDGQGNGYAAFRMANQNGRLSGFDDFENLNVDVDYAPNVHVGEVRAEGGGRGIFCVSGSGGAVIDHVELRGVGTRPAIFVEDCYNVRIGAAGGTVDRAGADHEHDIAITARSATSSERTFLFYSAGVIVENLTLIGSPVGESACDASGNPRTNRVQNNTLIDSPLSVCPGTDVGNVLGP